MCGKASRCVLCAASAVGPALEIVQIRSVHARVATIARMISVRFQLLAHHVVRAILGAAASGRSRHKILGRPPRSAGSRSISRPSDRSTEAASGLGPFGSRSLRQEHRRHPYARFHDEHPDWSPYLACMLHCSSRINLYPVERQWLVPKSCILVAARLQDGRDSSLVRLIRPTRHPQSHILPGSGPEAWAKLNQLVKQSRSRRSEPCRSRHIARERSPACARAR
jgi:hypothetical protein